MKKTSAVFHVLLLRSKNSSSYHYCSKAIFLMTGLVVMNSCHSIHLKFGLRLILQAALFGLRLIEFANRINCYMICQVVSRMILWSRISERQMAKGFFRGARLSLFHNGGIVQLFVRTTLFVTLSIGIIYHRLDHN